MKSAFKGSYYRLRSGLLHLLGITVLGSRVQQAALPSRVGKILFIRIDRIGDMVVSMPAILALKRQYPQAKLTVFASRANHALLGDGAGVDEVVVIEEGLGRNPVRFLKRLGELRGHGYDLVIDPMTGPDLETALIAFATGAPVRAGFSGGGREVFFNRVTRLSGRDRHVVDLTLDLVEGVGVVTADRSPRLSIQTRDSAWARDWLQANLAPGGPIVGLHPGAYYPSQRWPVGHFARLGEGLQRDLQHRTVLIGGPGDLTLIKDIIASSNQRIPVYSGADLRRTAAVMSRLDALVCNNSGPLHLAAALGVPTVSFMGPTNSVRWWPRGRFQRVLRVDGLECLGCEMGTCPKGSLECMQGISPAMAQESVREILGETVEKPKTVGRP